MGCQRTEPGAASRPELLIEGAHRLGLELDEAMLTRFQRYFKLLAEQGSRHNLTSVLDYEGVQRRHYLESLAVSAVLARRRLLRGDEAAIDVGSGAGFPGLPLRIVWPSLRLTLLEATRKKADFLRLVVDELGLAGTVVVSERAEDAAHRADLRERFDLVLARAVAPLPALAELTLPFARRGGVAALVKGSRLEAELAAAWGAISTCGGGTPEALALGAAGIEISTRLLLVPKRAHTPRGLPRAAGVPARNPLR